MLGRLARWLRIFGYDAEYVTEKGRPSVLLRSLKENKILITRDQRLSSKRAAKLILIASDHVEEQIKQLIDQAAIAVSKDRFFTRCTICNVSTAPVTNKEELKALVPDYVFQTQTVFSRCPACGKIYWPGTHWELLLRDLAKAGIKIKTDPVSKAHS